MFEGKPKEKLLERGVSSLSNAELIEILINTGVRNATASEIANLVLKRSNGTLSDLARLNVHDLTQIDGIGLSKAVGIISTFELGRRRYSESFSPSEKIDCSSVVYGLFRDLADLPHETFWILLLKKNNTVMAKKKISEGGVDGTVVDVKIILKHALGMLSSSIILIHNHPSGNPSPSHQDIAITKKIKEA
ncbi:MAG: JAB domain-containing protein, partial [Bacteroidota bacterium]|nr:JAB domain-containing protein [Bacteroidota bacterium]